MGSHALTYTYTLFPMKHTIHKVVYTLFPMKHTQSTKLFMIRLVCTTFQNTMIPGRTTAAGSHTKIQKVLLVGSDLITGCIITNLAT